MNDSYLSDDQIDVSGISDPLESPNPSSKSSFGKLASLVRFFFIVAGLYRLLAYGFIGLFAEDLIDLRYEREAAEARAEGYDPAPDLSGERAELKAGMVHLVRVTGFSFATVGAAFLILARLIRRRPLVAVSLGIPLYLGDWIGMAMTYPSKAATPLWITARIVFLAVLVLTIVDVQRQRNVVPAAGEADS